MSKIEKPVSGQPVSARWMGRVVDKVNRDPKAIKQANRNSRFVSAVTGLVSTIPKVGVAITKAIGDTWTGGIAIDDRAKDDERLFQFDRGQIVRPRNGRFAVAAESVTGDGVGQLYFQGVFPALVWFRDVYHEFCDVEGEGIYGEFPFPEPIEAKPLISCIDGAARIYGREDVVAIYTTTALRILAAGVTQQHIDDSALFGDLETGAYYRPSGSVGSVTWTESPMECYIEKPTEKPTAITYAVADPTGWPTWMSSGDVGSPINTHTTPFVILPHSTPSDLGGSAWKSYDHFGTPQNIVKFSACYRIRVALTFDVASVGTDESSIAVKIRNFELGATVIAETSHTIAGGSGLERTKTLTAEGLADLVTDPLVANQKTGFSVETEIRHDGDETDFNITGITFTAEQIRRF